MTAASVAIPWRRHGEIVTGVILVGLLALAALLGPTFGLPSPYDLDVTAMLAGPSAGHPFGTDELGRDLLSRTLHAGRISLAVAAIAGGIGLLFGTAIGVTAAWCGGWLDLVLMRLMELLFSFPAMLLAIVLMASLGTSVLNAVIAIGLVFIPGFSRLARAATADVLRQPFILAAQAVGTRPLRIVRREVLPGIAGPVLAEAASAFSYAILFEAALSFLGLGAQPPEPSWGVMLNTGRGFLDQAPWLSLVPGGAVFLTVLGFHLIGDGLRDLYDPRLRD